MTQFKESKNVSDMINGNFEAQGVKPLSNTAVWYDDESKSFYEAPVDSPTFLSENEIMHYPDLVAAASSYVKDGDLRGDIFSNVSVFKGRYQALADSYYRQYLPQIQQYRRLGMTPDAARAIIETSAIASASATAGGGGGAVHPDTLGAIQRVNVLAGIMAIGEVDYLAQDAVPIKNVQFIKGTFFKRKQMKAQRNIRLGKPILTTQVEIEDMTYEIAGIGTHVATHWETKLIPYYVDLYQESLNDVARAITEVKAEEVKETVESHGTTPVTFASWSAISTGTSTRNPVLDINTAMTTITKNGGRPSRMTIGPAGSAALETNRWALEGNAPSIITQMGQNKKYNWRGLTVTADAMFTADKAILFSDNAFQTYQGPKQAFDYENVHTRIRGEYYLEYHGSQVSNSLEVVELADID
jgi:hypothetical protein